MASQTFQWETHAPGDDASDWESELLRLPNYQVNGAPGCLWTEEARE